MATNSYVYIVPQNSDGSFSTSIVYVIKKWFDIDSVKTNEQDMVGRNVAGPFNKDANGQWTLDLSNLKISNKDTRRFYVTAKSRNSTKIPDVSEGGISPDDPYFPAVVDWLQNFPEKTIQLARYYDMAGNEVGKGGGENSMLNLKEMYWLDIPPVSIYGPEDQWEWIFRGGMGTLSNSQVAHDKILPDGSTNVLVTVTMMISNRAPESGGLVYPPQMLRGLEPGSISSNYNERIPGNSWTSVTFKITGKLTNRDTFRPLRWFTFCPESFSDASAADPFSRTIELPDPHSNRSPGYSYGWDAYPNDDVIYRWNIDDTLGPFTIYQLNDDNALLTPATP